MIYQFVGKILIEIKYVTLYIIDFQKFIKIISITKTYKKKCFNWTFKNVYKTEEIMKNNNFNSPSDPNDDYNGYVSSYAEFIKNNSFFVSFSFGKIAYKTTNYF